MRDAGRACARFFASQTEPEYLGRSQTIAPARNSFGVATEPFDCLLAASAQDKLRRIVPTSKARIDGRRCGSR